MTKHYVMNAELGSDATFDELIQRIENFDWNNCALTDAGKVIHATRLLAEETVRRHRAMRLKEKELNERAQVADVLDEMTKTLSLNSEMKAKRKSYFWR